MKYHHVTRRADVDVTIIRGEDIPELRNVEEAIMLDITRQTANFVASLKPADIPARCREAARPASSIASVVMIAGASEQPVRIVSAMCAASTQNDGAPEIPSGRNLAASDAALVNGVAAHVLDYDDVALSGHPSAVLVPAILAEGWSSDASGADAVAAYAAGYEMWAQVAALEPGNLHERGFHPTAVMGHARGCRGLRPAAQTGPEKTAHAIAIAASLASGLVANFGTMTKSLHAGRAAQSGVLAARLAEPGIYGLSRCAGAQDRIPSRSFAVWHSEHRERDGRHRHQLAAGKSRGQREALSDLLRDASFDRRDARSGR